MGWFQRRVRAWVISTFSEEILKDRHERSLRFFEEAAEVVQAAGLSEEQALDLVRHTYSRPAGDPRKEIGGAMTTLHALADAWDVDAGKAGWDELGRNWEDATRIRDKWLTKQHRTYHAPVES